MERTRILHVVLTMNTGGLEMVVKNILLNTKDIFDNACLICRNEETDYEKELRENGITIYHIPAPDSLKLSFYKNLSSFFKSNHNFSIVHTHMSFSNGVVVKAAKKNGIKTVISHSHEMERDKDRSPIKHVYSSFMRRLILKNSDVYMACSTNAGNFLFGAAPFKEKGRVLYNGVDISCFASNQDIRNKARKTLGLENKIVLGSVGSLYLVKNQIVLVKMLKHNPDFVALIIGEGDERQRMSEYAQKEGLTDRLILPGKSSEVEYYLNAMDVFVFPSVSEGFGIALIEAQANGLPCLVSEAIQDEAIVNRNIKKLSLKDSTEKWAKEALELSKMPRETNQKGLIEKGLDIRTNMKDLISFYSSLDG